MYLCIRQIYIIMDEVYLNCVLMSNNEIIFCGRSLGFLATEEKENFIVKKSDIKPIKN